MNPDFVRTRKMVIRVEIPIIGTWDKLNSVDVAIYNRFLDPLDTLMKQNYGKFEVLGEWEEEL